MKSWINDLRYALRQLRKSKGFALTALLTIALGVGAVTAVFSVVNTVLLRPYPFRDPGQMTGIAPRPSRRSNRRSRSCRTTIGTI